MENDFGEIAQEFAEMSNNDAFAGANGTGVLLVDDNKIKGNLRFSVKTGIQKHGFNDFVSNLIPVNRSLPDYRDKW